MPHASAGRSTRPSRRRRSSASGWESGGHHSQSRQSYVTPRLNKLVCHADKSTAHSVPVNKMLCFLSVVASCLARERTALSEHPVRRTRPNPRRLQRPPHLRSSNVRRCPRRGNPGDRESPDRLEGQYALAILGLTRWRDRDDRLNLRVTQEGKHLPNAISSCGDPWMRTLRRSNAHNRLRSFAKKPSQVWASAVKCKSALPMCPSAMCKV